MRAFVLAMAAALLPAVALAQTWVSIGATVDGEMYVDVTSPRLQGQHIKAWDRFAHATVQTFNAYPLVNYKSSKTLRYYDCKNGSYAVKQANYYDDAGGMGKIVYTVSYSDAQLDFQDPIPGTIGRRMLDWACGRR